jgi:hypothetical protein
MIDRMQRNRIRKSTILSLHMQYEVFVQNTCIVMIKLLSLLDTYKDDYLITCNIEFFFMMILSGI